MNLSLSRSHLRSLSRRRFLAVSGLAAAGAGIDPGRVLGAAGRVAPNSRLNLAFIGTGSQGFRVLFDFLGYPDVQVTAVCDVNRETSDYPQWGDNEFRNAVRRLLNNSQEGWIDQLSTSTLIELTRRQKVTAGTCGREPARRIVEAFYAGRTRSGEWKGCKAYPDFRELLEKEQGLDGVVICTGDHWHAHIAIAAMQRRRHVWCQKPMTHSVYEARRMGDMAGQTGLATQVAVGNAASEATRVLREWIATGAIGPVQEVINWSSRPFWPQAIDRPKEPMPVPSGLDWDLWCGPSPARPYHRIYHPFNWRGWHDFGCGAIGDMGCYSFDTIFRVLNLTAPATIEASSSERFEETYPSASIMRFEFPGATGQPPVRVTWYDGGLKPALPGGFADAMKLADEGLLFVGESGSVLCDFTGASPRLLPSSRQKDFHPPPKTLPRSPGHDREWLDACKGGREVPGANFSFSSRVTETILLGNVALRAGEKISWDPEGLQAVGCPAATTLIKPTYRDGWAL